MKIRMQQCLFLAILTTAFLAVICMLFIMKWSLGRGFLEYVNKTKQNRISTALVQAYEG